MLTIISWLLVLKSTWFASVLIPGIADCSTLRSHIFVARSPSISALWCRWQAHGGLLMEVNFFGMSLLRGGQGGHFSHITVALAGHNDAVVIDVSVVGAVVGIFNVVVWRWRRTFHFIACSQQKDQELSGDDQTTKYQCFRTYLLASLGTAATASPFSFRSLSA